MKRTTQQNKAMHLFCDLLAESLNDAGLDMKKTLKPQVDIPWNGERVKEFLWRPIQEALTEKESTTELDTIEPSAVHAVLMRHMSEKFGIYVDFPSEETRPQTSLSKRTEALNELTRESENLGLYDAGNKK